MKRAFVFRGIVSKVITIAFFCALLVGALGWQFVPSQQRPQPTLQQQLDALPRANGTGLHASPEGGLVRLSNQRVIQTKVPIKLWALAGLDGGGAKIVYTGPPDRAAIELTTYRPDGWYFGPTNCPTICNLQIESTGKGIGFDPTLKGNAEYITIRDVSVSAAGDAIDLRPPTGWCHNVTLQNIVVYRPGAAALYLNSNVVSIDGFKVRGGPRDEFRNNPPPAFVNLKGVTGGGGEIRNLQVEAYTTIEEPGKGRIPNPRDSVPSLIVDQQERGATWVMNQGHIEQPGPQLIIVRGRDTALTIISPGTLWDAPVRVTGGARLMVLTPNEYPEHRLQRDAQSEITVNGAKRGVLIQNDAK